LRRTCGLRLGRMSENGGHDVAEDAHCFLRCLVSSMFVLAPRW
jgi:hypothetical protein